MVARRMERSGCCDRLEYDEGDFALKSEGGTH